MSQKSKLTGETYIRSFQNPLTTFFNILPNPDKVLNRNGRTIEVYKELKNDPHVWSCIQSRKSGLLCLDYIISPNGADTEIAQFIQSVFDALDVQQIERDILEAPLYGFQPLEIVWKIEQSSVQRIVPDKVIPKPQEWFAFDSDGNLRFKKAGDLKGEIPPLMKILCIQHEASYLNPYGQSLLSKCYWSVSFKNGGLRFWVNFTEKYGMPILTGQYERNASAEEAEKLVSELNNMAEDAVIVMPSDIKIQLHEASRNTSAELYRDLIKFCDAEISKAILSQTLTTELDMGSYAATLIHYKVRREVILSDIRLIESAFNTLIGWIVDLNFPSKPSPKFRILINESENQDRVDRDLKISQTGTVKLTKQYWMNTYGFNHDEIEEKL